MPSAAAATPVEVGTKVSKDDVYLTSERWFAEHERGMVAGKGISRRTGFRVRGYLVNSPGSQGCPGAAQGHAWGYPGKRAMR